MPSASAEEVLVRRIYDEVCNGRRADVAAEVFAADHRLHDPQLPAADGPQGIVDGIAGYQNDFDGWWDVHDVLVCGDKVTVRWTGVGRHVSDRVHGHVPTGSEVGPVHGISIHRIADGKVAETWQVSDTLTMLQHIGVVPIPYTGANA